MYPCIALHFTSLHPCSALHWTAQEYLFLPLFEVLASEVSYTVRCGELVAALAMACHGATLFEKLRYCFDQFDYDARCVAAGNGTACL
jgi:hypothetical protein